MRFRQKDCLFSRLNMRALRSVELSWSGVITIIGILIALLLPAVQVGPRGGPADAMLQQRQAIGPGAARYHTSYGIFPPSSEWCVRRPDEPSSTSPAMERRQS